MGSRARSRALRVCGVLFVGGAALGAGCGSSRSSGGAPPDGGTVIPASGGARSATLLAGSWRFAGSDTLAGAEAPGYDDSSWTTIAVPHTWDIAKSPFLLYSNAWYRTHFTLPASDAGRRVYLQFEGVGTVADVYVNGTHAGQHRGAYTRFVFDVTDAVTFGGDNVLAVRTDNTDADTVDCLPSHAYSREYYLPYGGIYRKAWLVETDAVHVDPTEYATSGVTIVPANVSAAGADVTVRTTLRNAGRAAVTAHVSHRFLDAAGATVLSLEGDVPLPAGSRDESALAGHLAGAHLWSTADPYLYGVVTDVAVGGAVRDEVRERTGFRSFALTPTSFTLNGTPTPLRGVNKHQESERSRVAMSDAELTEDWDRLQELGVNYVRLPHYPHAKLEVDLADERGILVWAENGQSGTPQNSDTGERITREMVRQNANHPSIVFFSVGNEVDGSAEATAAIARYAAAVRQDDPTRLVTYASYGPSFSDTAVDFVAHNLYEGWYGGDAWGFEGDAAAVHYVSETGGRSVVSHHTDYATATYTLGTFEPEEYLGPIAESIVQTVFRTKADQIPLFTWWAQREFLNDGRPHGVNDSGLFTYDNFHRKDAFYLLQSFFRPALPVVHITGKTYWLRRGAANNGVKVYSNRPELRLVLNGTDAGALTNGSYAQPNGRTVENVFYWPVTLRSGMNYILVSDAQGDADGAAVYFAGAGGSPAQPDPTRIVQHLTSSNPANPAYFIDRPVERDFPVFYDFDGSADETFDDLPAPIAGSHWIGTLRTSKPGAATALAFDVNPLYAGADVYVMVDDDGSGSVFAAAGFADSGVTGLWRDAGEELVAFRVFARHAAGGEHVQVPAGASDSVVLVKGPGW
jgi:beta-galactosidase